MWQKAVLHRMFIWRNWNDISDRTGRVMVLHNQYQLRGNYDRCAAFYKKEQRPSAKGKTIKKVSSNAKKQTGKVSTE